MSYGGRSNSKRIFETTNLTNWTDLAWVLSSYGNHGSYGIHRSYLGFEFKTDCTMGENLIGLTLTYSY